MLFFVKKNTMKNSKLIISIILSLSTGYVLGSIMKKHKLIGKTSENSLLFTQSLESNDIIVFKSVSPGSKEEIIKVNYNSIIK